MDLRTADAFRDLSLGQILEESKHQDGSLAVGQSSDQGTYGFNVDNRVQIGVDVAEGVAERSYSSSGPACGSVERVK